MIETIEKWIRQVSRQHESVRQSCSQFADDFEGYFAPEFLAQCRFVVTPNIPTPDNRLLNQLGLGGFFGENMVGLTLNDTYYLLPSVAENRRIYFHELVHVVQWQQLGVGGCVSRYLQEYRRYGYEHMPLERMAYGLDGQFSSGGPAVDVWNQVRTII
ncbi:hypothetical protein [Marinobacter persicus]|uniref:DUF4157 domain-containing protein n=1 Tax=Marinobacter persicus TaxID=930118 RepID=A0A2S6G2K6_9GAMM|nr:hypothetical protein [Marinobacter persicus]PPK50048.1 hypothetical protein BY455_13618 [Marinobacter persicus]PPK52234.1 hypothetical protein B0H24_103618 [Marinobacter persicus]PPK56625.1 hypothetical protein BY454_13618 [Marinobacter persicus]